jgi:PadR family transcriptional regulator, regulatory protein PadR
VPIWGPHHNDVDLDTFEPVDAVHPRALDRRLAFDRHAERGEKSDSGCKVLDDDADVVQSLDRHVPSIAEAVRAAQAGRLASWTWLAEQTQGDEGAAKLQEGQTVPSPWHPPPWLLFCFFGCHHLLFSQWDRAILPVGNPIGHMKEKTDVLQGTLALMVLKTLDVLGPLHGYGIARRIEQISGDLLTVNQGTLYPVLLKLEQDGSIASEWGASENNRKARFYRLTRSGRKQLQAETQGWEQTAAIIGRFFAAKAEDLE